MAASAALNYSAAPSTSTSKQPDGRNTNGRIISPNQGFTRVTHTAAREPECPGYPDLPTEIMFISVNSLGITLS
ncbi:hypothetical protein ACWDZ8_26035 [Streptomyces sp. NPDC003233]